MSRHPNAALPPDEREALGRSMNPSRPSKALPPDVREASKRIRYEADLASTARMDQWLRRLQESQDEESVETDGPGR